MQNKTLGDPKNMRPSTRRLGFSGDDPIGEYKLRNGRMVQVIWLTIDQTRCNIVASPELCLWRKGCSERAAKLPCRFHVPDAPGQSDVWSGNRPYVQTVRKDSGP